MKIKPIRDVFFDCLYEAACKDANIVIVSVDLGAPSLDKFRDNLPEQFINVGISEQNAILVSAGLALLGKKVVVYGITEFLTIRALEQIKLYLCGMKISVIVAGVGVGASFYLDGMTHHSLEAISLLRIFPNLNVINCSDNVLAKEGLKYAINSDISSIILFEKENNERVFDGELDMRLGFRANQHSANIWIITTGIMTIEIKAILLENNYKDVGIIDVFNTRFNKRSLLNTICNAKKIVTVEENVLEGGLGSSILELLADNSIFIPVKRFGIDSSMGYKPSYNYSSRESIRKGYGLDKKKIYEYLNEIMGEKH